MLNFGRNSDFKAAPTALNSPLGWERPAEMPRLEQIKKMEELKMYIDIVKIKDEIKEIHNPSKQDIKVLAIVDSFWGCDGNWIKAYLASKISKYAGCEAWKISMEYVYGSNQ